MTTFDLLERSEESSRPIEIYEFLLGITPFRYTSAEDEISVGVNVYEPEPGLKRGRLVQNSNASSSQFVVKVPAGNSFAAQYRDLIPGVKARLRIWRLQRDEVPTFQTQALQFRGSVQNIRFVSSGTEAEIVCLSAEALGRRSTPRYTYMGACNHVLYDDQCGVDPALFTHVGNATVVNGNLLTVAGASGQPDGYWRGGVVQALGGGIDFRTVLQHSGDVLTLRAPFSVPVLGTSVQVFAGCNLQLTGDCTQKFNNGDRHGGSHFVPNKNPIEVGIGADV